MSIDMYGDVFAFHSKFGAAIGAAPHVPSVDLQGLRWALMVEEMRELEKAIVHDDIVEVADACADLIYVVLGTAITYGIDLRPVWEAVHASNMAKFGGGERADGKILKPEGWTPPDIKGLLVEQGAQL